MIVHRWAPVVAAGLVLAGCGGALPVDPGDPSGRDQPAADAGAVDDGLVHIFISPESAHVAPRGSLQFSAQITGQEDQSVVWSMATDNSGTVTQTGVYTAPNKEGDYQVVVTVATDFTRNARANVRVSRSSTCSDSCAAPKGGVKWTCKKRFMYGTNWGWKSFAGDFGGISHWNIKGVSAAKQAYGSDLQKMKNAGVNVIRWWMFPRFFTDSIRFGSDDAPTGIGGTLEADIHAALELAEAHDVYLMLTPFSFDNFAATRTEYGIYTRGLRPMIVNDARRQKLMDNLVAPVARAVEASPHKSRMIAWDIINEPEWAMSGSNLYGGEGFSPTTDESVTHAQMETFLRDTSATLRANSSALITVGGSAIKWANAWRNVDQDFHQFHWYDWVYEWYPYTKSSNSLRSLGIDDKPVVAGEFPGDGLSAIPSKGLPARSLHEFVEDLWDRDWAGALSWAYNDPSFPWSSSTMESFPEQYPCETAY